MQTSHASPGSISPHPIAARRPFATARFAPAFLLAAAGAAAPGCSEARKDPVEGVATTAEAQTCVTLERTTAGSSDVVDALLVYDPADPLKERTAHGSGNRLGVGFVGSATQRAALRFDLGAIPSGSVVHSATMTFRMIQSPGGGDVGMRRITVPWDEPTATWSLLAKAPDSGFDPALLATAPTRGVPANSNVSVDWTPIVAAWVSGSQPNYGVLLDHEAAGRTLIASSEAPSLGPRPKLVVCYDPPSCSDGVQNQGEAGVDCGGPCADCTDLCAGVTCAAADDCHLAGTCDPATGLCSSPTAPDGAACDDGDACTADACARGFCVGSPIDVDDGDACTSDVCDPESGVSHPSTGAPGCYGTADHPGFSCWEIQEQGASTGDGTYWIAPGGQDPFEVYCDMTRHGGGWILAGAIGTQATATSAFDGDLATDLLLDPAPSGSTFAHFDWSRFDAFGPAWTARAATDAANDESHFQYAFYRPKVTASILPSQVGRDWGGSAVYASLVHLTTTSTTGLSNTTWLDVPACGGGFCDCPVTLFAYRVEGASGACLGTDDQTAIGHAVQGSLACLGGTMTADSGMLDDVASVAGRRGTYWIRDTAYSGAP